MTEPFDRSDIGIWLKVGSGVSLLFVAIIAHCIMDAWFLSATAAEVGRGSRKPRREDKDIAMLRELTWRN